MPSGQHSRFALQAEAVRVGHDWQPAAGRAPIEIDGELFDIEAGDRLQLYTQISAPVPRIKPANSITPTNCEAIVNSADCGATILPRCP